jgi:hypothetical protein
VSGSSARKAQEAGRIIAGRIGEDREIQGVSPTPAGTAERFKLGLGQARLL